MKKAIIIALTLLLTGCSNLDEEKFKQEIKDEIALESTFDSTLLNDHFRKVSSEISLYTVAITVTVSDQELLGSGIIYENSGNDYYILTNEHVIRYADSIEVFFPSENAYFEATIVKQDADKDLAILKITTLEILNCYQISNEVYAVGELVFSVGSPTSIEYSNSITLGIISRIDDEVIQHDAAINSGNSGGPLFNLEGNFIGINVSKINTTLIGNNAVNVEGVGFAIKLETILTFINE